MRRRLKRALRPATDSRMTSAYVDARTIHHTMP